MVKEAVAMNGRREFNANLSNQDEHAVGRTVFYCE